MRVSAGGKCSSSSYQTLLYVLSAAVGVLLLLLAGLVVMFKVSGRCFDNQTEVSLQTASACRERARVVPLQLAAKPHWFHNFFSFLLQVVNMFISELREDNEASFHLFVFISLQKQGFCNTFQARFRLFFILFGEVFFGGGFAKDTSWRGNDELWF